MIPLPTPAEVMKRVSTMSRKARSNNKVAFQHRDLSEVLDNLFGDVVTAGAQDNTDKDDKVYSDIRSSNSDNFDNDSSDSDDYDNNDPNSVCTPNNGNESEDQPILAEEVFEEENNRIKINTNGDPTEEEETRPNGHRVLNNNKRR